jgi:hypothetical protein
MEKKKILRRIEYLTSGETLPLDQTKNLIKKAFDVFFMQSEIILLKTSVTLNCNFQLQSQKTSSAQSTFSKRSGGKEYIPQISNTKKCPTDLPRINT